MKLIEALKKIKRYSTKIADIQKKIAEYCADMDVDTPIYGSDDKQRSQISEWIQSIHDMVKELADLKQSIRITNISTKVTIEIDGKRIEKSIAEWIDRRVLFANTEKVTWQCLTDKQLKPQNYYPVGAKKPGYGEQVTNDVQLSRVRLYYDPKVKNHMIEVFSDEPGLIDEKLEVVNAETDLL